jgi:hypothetical protein
MLSLHHFLQVYLLEKSRVVRQGEGERNYHILHYLASGASAEERRLLHILQPEKYAYLSNEARKIPGCNDAAMFKAVCQCLAALVRHVMVIPLVILFSGSYPPQGIEATTSRELWRMAAAVLALGNIVRTSTQLAPLHKLQLLFKLQEFTSEAEKADGAPCKSPHALIDNGEGADEPCTYSVAIRVVID